MATNFYDVIVLGNELAGLVAAALVARRGYRVLILGEAAHAQSYQVGPFALPVAPFALVGLETPVARRLLGELGLTPVLRRKIAPLKPHYQVILSDHRLDIHDDPDLNTREIEREFPSDIAAIGTFLCKVAETSAVLDEALDQDITLPPDSFWARRELGRFESRLPSPEENLLAALPSPHPYHAVASVPAWLGADLSLEELGPAGLARHLELWRTGVWRVEGGRDTLRQILLERICNSAGEVRERATPEEILVKRGRVAGVKLVERGEEIGCEHVIAAMPAKRLASLLSDDRPPKALAHVLEGMVPRGFRYTLNLVLSVAGLPEAVGGVVCAIGNALAPLNGSNTLGIFVGESEEEGRVVVSVQALAPPQAEHDPAVLFDLRLAIRSSLEDVLPFYGEHLLLVDSPHDDAPPEGMYRTVVVRQPLPMDAVWSSKLPRALGVTAAPHETGIKRLYLCGRQNVPALGFEGELLSGWGCARLICADEPRKNLLKREVLFGSG